MTRSVFVFLMAGALLLGISRSTCHGGPLTSKSSDTPNFTNAKHIAGRLGIYVSIEAAMFIAEAILRESMKHLVDGKYTAKPIAIIESPKNLGPCLALPKSFDVIMLAMSDGKPVSKDPLSLTVPYDPNAKVFMTSIVKVEVAAFYPIKGIQYIDGRLSLPKDPVVIAGYLGEEGERSTWEYHGGALWDDDKCKAVANDLTLKALDVAREHYARSQATTEGELSKTFEKAVDQLLFEVTKGLNRRKP